jgi:hypothetical protein
VQHHDSTKQKNFKNIKTICGGENGMVGRKMFGKANF